MTSLIEAIRQSGFAVEAPSPHKASESCSGGPPGVCPECLGESFWQPHRSDKWFCDGCHAPSTDSLVAQRHPPAPVVEVSEVIVMAGGPVCRNCGGAWYVETWDGVDGLGTTTLTCWTCHHPVDGEIQLDLIRMPKRRGICQSKRRKS